MNISLTPQLEKLVQDRVKSGRYTSASEVVREALRRYEDEIETERASIAAIHAAAEEGLTAIARGDFIAVWGESGSRDLLDRLNREAADSSRRGG